MESCFPPTPSMVVLYLWFFKFALLIPFTTQPSISDLISSLFHQFFWFLSLIICNCFKPLSFLWRKSHTELPCFFFHSLWTVLYSESYQFLFPVYLVVFPGISRWIGIGCIAPEVCATVPSQGLVCWGNLRELQLLHDSGNCSCADSCLNSEVTKHRLTFQILKVLFF